VWFVVLLVLVDARFVLPLSLRIAVGERTEVPDTDRPHEFRERTSTFPTGSSVNQVEVVGPPVRVEALQQFVRFWVAQCDESKRAVGVRSHFAHQLVKSLTLRIVEKDRRRYGSVSDARFVVRSSFTV
jgi:hypothetical protein